MLQENRTNITLSFAEQIPDEFYASQNMYGRQMIIGKLRVEKLDKLKDSGKYECRAQHSFPGGEFLSATIIFEVLGMYDIEYHRFN